MLKNNPGYILIANEDKLTACYFTGKKKVRITYATYLAFWFNSLLHEVENDIDNCIFKYKLNSYAD